MHFDPVSKLQEAAAELPLHDSERLLTVATGFLRRLGRIVGLPALADGKNDSAGGEGRKVRHLPVQKREMYIYTIARNVRRELHAGRTFAGPCLGTLGSFDANPVYRALLKSGPHDHLCTLPGGSSVG